MSDSNLIVVTGAAGFIGSNIVKGLNERGYDNILAVDNLKRSDKFINLLDCQIYDYIDKNEFLDRLQSNYFASSCTSTLRISLVRISSQICSIDVSMLLLPSSPAKRLLTETVPSASSFSLNFKS